MREEREEIEWSPKNGEDVLCEIDYADDKPMKKVLAEFIGMADGIYVVRMEGHDFYYVNKGSMWRYDEHEEYIKMITDIRHELLHRGSDQSLINKISEIVGKFDHE